MKMIKRSAALLFCITAMTMTGCAYLEELVGSDTDTDTIVTSEAEERMTFFQKEVKKISAEELTEQMVSEAFEFKSSIHIEGKIDPDDVDSFTSLTSFEYPELFWIAGYNMSYNDYEADIELDIIEGLSIDEIVEMSNELDREAEIIVEAARQLDSDYEKALYVHDAIIEACEYDSENVGNNETAHLWGTAYGALVQHKAICQGYAEAYKLIMDKLGIECGICGGMASNESHAWNYVKLDGEYYWADLTWDDPILNGESGFLTHVYFMFDDELLYKDRTIDEYVGLLPECRSMDMNYYVQNGCYFDTYDFNALDEAAVNAVGDDKLEFMFADDETYEEARTALLENGDVWQLSPINGVYDTLYPIEYEQMRVIAICFEK